MSPYLWPNGTLPNSAEYRRLQAGGWHDYRLKLGGLVQNPHSYSFAGIGLGQGGNNEDHEFVGYRMPI